jgi:magnesium chelatase family protein
MEWSRDSKECLREPLEARSFQLTRVQGSLHIPCDLQLVATGNLCPCGGFPSELRPLLPGVSRPCRCSPLQVRTYLSRLSGPVLERIDLPVLLGDESQDPESTDAPARLETQAAQARDFSRKQFGALASALRPEQLESELEAHPTLRTLLGSGMSLRFRHKTLRVAKSIQALDSALQLREHHVLEALSLRALDSRLGGW